MDNYNSSVHSFLKIPPNLAETAEFQGYLQLLHAKKYAKFTKKPSKYKIGQTVRVSIQKSKFGQRGYFPQFSNEKFLIVDISEKLPIPLYILKSIDNEEDGPIEGKFYESEIFPVE